MEIEHAVLRINAQETTPVLHGDAHPLRMALEAAVQAPGPVVVMLHGYKFLPHDSRHCPHGHIFALKDHQRDNRVISWPRRLGMADGTAGEGLAIAFGWNARGTIWQARESAKKAAQALATLIRMIRKARPDQPVHLLAHSMGAYLALKSMLLLEEGDVGRVIVMNGALYRGQAEAALASGAGQAAEMINMASRENAIYDTMFEYMLWPDQRGDRVMGRGFSAANALTIDLSDRVTLDVLTALGHPIAQRDRRYCHWSTYLRPGIFSFYQALLRAPETTSLYRLKSEISAILPDLPFDVPPVSSIANVAHQA